MGRYRKYSQADHEALGTAAVAWADHVLPYFESANPDDPRPHDALEVCRAWLTTGAFAMAEIRTASLAAHAAARNPNNKDAACWAARAAGHAVATAHVAQHAYGAAYYALKVIAVTTGADALKQVEDEREWQSLCLPVRLRDEFLERVVIRTNRGRVAITIDKSNGF
jgi:hypothetical protein